MRAAYKKEYQRWALNAASRSEMRHKVGCVIVDKGKHRYAAAWNRFLGDPEGHGWSLHAEAWCALRAEDFDVEPLYAFIARHNGRLARPCEACLGALRSIGVKTICYTTSPGKWEEEELSAS